jgi:hypothetical protein
MNKWPGRLGSNSGLDRGRMWTPDPLRFMVSSRAVSGARGRPQKFSGWGVGIIVAARRFIVKRPVFSRIPSVHQFACHNAPQSIGRLPLGGGYVFSGRWSGLREAVDGAGGLLDRLTVDRCLVRRMAPERLLFSR